MSPYPKVRSSIAALSVFGTVAGGAAFVLSAARPAAAVSKVTICHRTHSTTNPYRRISVAPYSAARRLIVVAELSKVD